MSQVSELILADCVELAVTGGNRALLGRERGLVEIETKSSATDMVTEFDRETESYIVGEIRIRRPDDSIIGEEGASFAGTSQYTWCIDPIDGTTNFLYAHPGWSVSIGVSDAVGPIAGVVFVPATQELFTATRGGGAFLNGKKIWCNQGITISAALLATGFSYLPQERTLQTQRVSRIIAGIRDIRRLGAASIDCCYVACGRLDGYFEENLKPWDVAAAELIAKEAGATTSDFSGNHSRPEEFLVCAPEIHRNLVDLIQRGKN